MTERRFRPLVWIDGRFVSPQRALLPVEDRGLRLGDGCLETVLVHRGTPVLWARHERRLRSTVRELGMAPLPRGLAALAGELIHRSAAREAALRILVTRGLGAGVAPARRSPPRVVLSIRSLEPDLERRRLDGIAAIRLSFGRGLGRPTSSWKTLDYLPSVLGRRQAALAGADEGLFVEVDGRVSEATTANVFVVRGDGLRTPSLASGCLAGITREVILELAQRLRIRYRESLLTSRDLDRADEIFLSSSISGIVPVTSLDGAPVGSGSVGPVCRRMQLAYGRLLERPRA